MTTPLPANYEQSENVFCGKMTTKAETLAALRQQLRATDRARQTGRRAPVSLLREIDAALPWNGFARGGMHEILADPGDAAAYGFVAALLARVPATDGRILWCRSGPVADVGRPYGPGLAAFGLPTDRLVFLETRRADETLWALEEGLRCRRLAAVVGEGVETTMTTSRRLHLAAEAGDTLGLLLAGPRPGTTSAALTRWRVSAAPAAPDGGGIGAPRWAVSLLRCRGGEPHDWLLEFDDEALRLSLASDLADGPVAAAQ